MFRIGGIAHAPDHVLAMLDPGSAQRRANRSGANDSDTHEYLLVSRESERLQRFIKTETPKWPSSALASRSPIDLFARAAAMTDNSQLRVSCGPLGMRRNDDGNAGVRAHRNAAFGAGLRLRRSGWTDGTRRSARPGAHHRAGDRRRCELLRHRGAIRQRRIGKEPGPRAAKAQASQHG